MTQEEQFSLSPSFWVYFRTLFSSFVYPALRNASKSPTTERTMKNIPTANPAVIPGSTGLNGLKQCCPPAIETVESKQQPKSFMHSVSVIPANPHGSSCSFVFAFAQNSVSAILLQKYGRGSSHSSSLSNGILNY